MSEDFFVNISLKLEKFHKANSLISKIDSPFAQFLSSEMNYQLLELIENKSEINIGLKRSFFEFSKDIEYLSTIFEIESNRTKKFIEFNIGRRTQEIQILLDKIDLFDKKARLFFEALENTNPSTNSISSRTTIGIGGINQKCQRIS